MDITEIWKFDLRRGNSRDPREGACIMDAISWLEYGTLGDHPACVCPVIAAYGRGINDAMSDVGRQRLKVFIPRLVGTVDPASEQARAEYLAWQAIRVFAPLALDAAGHIADARKLRDFNGTLEEADSAAIAAAKAAIAASADSAAIAAAKAAIAASAASAASAAIAAAKAAKAAIAASAAAKAAWAAIAENAMIAALDGVLQIGRRAEPLIPERVAESVRAFAVARGEIA